MKILLVNDDGYYAPGIKVLAQALTELGEVTIVAPERNCSGASSSITTDMPLRYHQVNDNTYAVSGSPVDCIHMGVHEIMDAAPDVIVSGINAGANLGDDVIYSGTVAAALEARFHQISGIAVSLLGPECKNYATAAKVVVELLGSEQRAQEPLICNINVPDIAWEELKGIRPTRLGHREPAEPVHEAKDAKGQSVFWVAPPGKGKDVSEGSDFWAVDNGYASITPLHVDLTDFEKFYSIDAWIGHPDK